MKSTTFTWKKALDIRRKYYFRKWKFYKYKVTKVIPKTYKWKESNKVPNGVPYYCFISVCYIFAVVCYEQAIDRFCSNKINDLYKIRVLLFLT